MKVPNYKKITLVLKEEDFDSVFSQISEMYDFKVAYEHGYVYPPDELLKAYIDTFEKEEYYTCSFSDCGKVDEEEGDTCNSCGEFHCQSHLPIRGCPKAEM